MELCGCKDLIFYLMYDILSMLIQVKDKGEAYRQLLNT